MLTIEDIKNEIENNVFLALSVMSDVSDEDVGKCIDEAIQNECINHPLSVEEKLSIKKGLFNRIRRYDIIQDYIEDISVTEIMVNGTNEIFIEKGGKLYSGQKRFDSEERLMDIINSIASGVNRVVNISSPIMDARLPDGSRVNVVLPPIALNGPILTIRRFPKKAITDDDLISMKSCSEEVLLFLKRLVYAGYNILISGGTGAGKTTFLNVLSNYIPSHERIITIEDSAELQIKGIENLVRLEARKANSEELKSISIRDLIRTSLRMRPDRIVVGEVRGEEAIDMLQAFNVGQDGSLSTIHANSAADALLRLETMIMLSTEIPLGALRRQIASGVDILVHLGRLRDSSRRLLEIREIVGIEDNNIKTTLLYEFCEESVENGHIVGSHMRRNAIYNRDKLIRAGIKDEI